MADIHRCPQCGAELAQEVAQGLCPKCLMKAGLGSRTEAGEAETMAPPGFPAASPVQAYTPPEAGKTFGSYHLVRLLGQGGMGAVYEAEQMDSGRRVALKILSQSLDSAEARAWFLREGRLAATAPSADRPPGAPDGFAVSPRSRGRQGSRARPVAFQVPQLCT